MERPGAPNKQKILSDEKVMRLPNSPIFILGLEANSKKPNIKVSEAGMTEKIASLDSFPTVPHRQRSVRRNKPKALTFPNTHQQKGSEILKPQHGRKKKCKQKADETVELEVVRPSSGRERLKRRMSSGNEITHLQGKLDTCTFQCYFENLWRSFPDEKRNSFAYLDCLWFNLYLKPYWQGKVLKWIKKKQIFSKKYVIVPIVRWDHWSLLIFCHMGESLESKTSPPCMLLLDSLRKTNPKRLEPEIRKFVLDLYKTEERPESRKQIYRIPLKIPNVPQQMNGEDCGNFVLYYINLFIENAPESFSISEGYPYFMKKDWFTQDSLADFRGRLREGDNVMSAVQFQDNSFNGNLERRGRTRNQVHIADHHPSSEISSENLERRGIKRKEVHVADPHPSSEISSENLERQGRKQNQVHVGDHYSSEISSENHQEKRVKENKSGSSKKKEKMSNEDLNMHISTQDDVSQDTVLIYDISFDEGAVPPPVCSCTGVPRQCYKANGGWQSSCCTRTLSVYPLPHLPNKRHSRIVGRKMSGNVFRRLLTRLAEEGHDLSVPLDLKNYWAKHGTNHYITVK